MWNTFLEKVGSGIFTLLLSIASLFGTIPSQEFGSQLAVGGETYYLSGSGLTSTDTTINLTQFGYTKPDGTYQKFLMEHFGTLGCGTLQGGNMAGKQEFISFTGITQNSDGTTQLTGISRGLERFSPYTASTTLQTSHAGGTKFVVSNSPPCFYENYVTINNAETISSVKTFTSTTAPKYDVSYTASGNEFISYTQMNSIAIAGAGTSTEDALGLVRIATNAQASASTASSTSGAPLFLSPRYATSTRGTLGSYIVMSESDGKLNQSWLDLNENFTFTASTTHASTTAYNLNTGSITATSSVKIPATSVSPLILNGFSTNWPSSAPSVSSSTMVMDTTGKVRYTNPAPEILLNDGTIYTSTGATTTVSLTIPAGKMGVDDSLEIYMSSVRTASTYIYAETGIGNGTATTTLVTAGASAASYTFLTRIFNNDSNSVQSFYSDVMKALVETHEIGTATVNTANQFYISFSVWSIPAASININGLRVLLYTK